MTMTDTQEQEKETSRFMPVIKQWLHTVWHGDDEKRRTQMMDVTRQTEEGARLLAFADEQNIPVRVGRARVRAEKGHVSKEDSDKTVSAFIANDGHPYAMSTTLQHELRHVEQQFHIGRLEKGWFHTVESARTSHMMALMMEADAFTVEIVSALQSYRTGDTSFIDGYVKRGGDMGDFVKRFMQENDPKDFKDDAALRRTLFTEIMLDQLTHYSASYFVGYYAMFQKSETRADFIEMQAELGSMPDVNAARPLATPYGATYTAPLSMTGLATVFLQALPEQERQTLKLVEKTASAITGMTEDQYQAARDKVSAATLAIYQTDPRDIFLDPKAEQARHFLREAARADVPPIAADFAKAARKKPEAARPQQKQAFQPKV